jgi:hypothetical protein
LYCGIIKRRLTCQQEIKPDLWGRAPVQVGARACVAGIPPLVMPMIKPVGERDELLRKVKIDLDPGKEGEEEVD